MNEVFLLRRYLTGSVLPTVIVVTILLLLGMLSLFALWEHETSLIARNYRFNQASADVESAYTLYRLYPNDSALTASNGYLLYDSLPQSRVFICVRPWGLYDAVYIHTSDSLLHACRLLGAKPNAQNTLFYANNQSAVALAGQTILQGILYLPQNGLIYSRVNTKFFNDKKILQTAIRLSTNNIPPPHADALLRLEKLFARREHTPYVLLPDSLFHPFKQESDVYVQVEKKELTNCYLYGSIILYADELHIDSTCHIEHALVCARKITVGGGARITAQLFAEDTVVVEPRAILEYPSGIYAHQYVKVEENSEVNGYVIIRDTVPRKKVSANYMQSRSAHVRGLVYVDGIAQVQGIVSGYTVLRQAVYFSPQGYYKDMLYDATLLENPITAQPFWLVSGRRKEVVCLE